MLFKLSVLIALVLCLIYSPFVYSQRVVWDNLIDLCYWPRSERPPTRCEGNADIKFERCLYRNSIPYYCLIVNNKEGAYNSLVIEYNGEKEFRRQINTFANEVPTDTIYQDSFILQQKIVKTVILPLNNKHPLQRITQIKLDNNTLCDATQPSSSDPVFRTHLKITESRLLNSCFDIKSRDQRERNQCEYLGEVIVEELKFNNEVRYYCVVVDKSVRNSPYSSESELIEVQLSTDKASTLFSPKSNRKPSVTATNNFRYHLIREKIFIALFPRNLFDNIGNITSLKLNSRESCTAFVVKPQRECGQVKKTDQYLITFGLPTESGQFPWHVGLFEHFDRSTLYFCGGSIIGSKTILTAAHCLDRDQGPINEERIRIKAGLHDISISDPNSREFRAQRYVLHDYWNKLGRTNDIAIIILQSYLIYSNYIQPICFTRDKHIFNDKEGSVVGWGVDEKMEQRNVLQRAPIRITSNILCRSDNPTIFETLVNESTFCGGYRNGTSACKGDSGGGLVFNFNDGWYIRGIVSVSTTVVDAQQQTRCDSLQYVVFTDVSEYFDWIDGQLSDLN